MRGERDIDDVDVVEQRRKKGNQGYIARADDKMKEVVLFKVGELVMYNGNRSCGFIIKVSKDFVKVISEQGKIQELKFNEIDKKLI